MNNTDTSPDEPRTPAAGPQDASLTSALLAAIVESSDDAIVSKSLDGIVLTWNPAATRIFGYQPDEIIGKSITLIIPPELQSEEPRILASIKAGERLEHFDTIRIAKDGKRIPISLTVSPIRNAEGIIVGASKIARDITQRKITEQALRDREEALRQADRRKDEFLTLLAHEMRNPLAPIRYALEASKKTTQPDLQRRTVEIIERQVALMSRLLEDLLDISRITRGDIEIKKVRTPLIPILESAIETARPALNAKDHQLLTDFPQQPLILEGDAVRLTQVFSNLLINAAKYTDAQGRVRVRAFTQGREILVTVEDSGIGISPDLLPHLFDLYAKGRDTTARAEGGLGIGLSLVRGIVGLHGGTVEAHSQGPGKGSKFLVRLPGA